MKHALLLAFLFFAPHSYALYGEKIESSREAYVVGLYNQENYFCSGVLIAPRLVLTAGHCIDMESIDKLGTSHALVYRPELVMIKVGKKFIQASSITLAPSYFEGLGFDTEDLALIELDSPATVSPAPIASKADLSANTSLTLIARSFKVQTKLLNSTTYSSGATVLKLHHSAGACLGDSGGAIMIKKNGQQLLAGILMYSGRGNCDKKTGHGYFPKRQF